MPTQNEAWEECRKSRDSEVSALIAERDALKERVKELERTLEAHTES